MIMDLKIGLQMYTVRNQTRTLDDLKSTLDKLAEIGIDLVQMGVPSYITPAELKALLDSYKMTMDSTGFSTGGTDFEKSIETAKIFGTNLIQTGSIPESMRSDADGYKRFADQLNREGAVFAAEGMKYIYHFHAFEFVTFGNTRGIDIMLNETDKSNVFFEPDVFWMTNAGVEPSVALKMFEGRTQWIHVKDYAILQLQGIIESVPYCFAPVGTGNLNWAGIFKTAIEMGVNEFVIEQDECQIDVFDSVKLSYDFLKKSLGI